jgi:hypothetical protein
MEIYIIRVENPLDMEGSADVAAVFIDKAVADEAAEKLNAQQEVECRKVYKDSWRSFALNYTVQTHRVWTSANAVVSAQSNYHE